MVHNNSGNGIINYLGRLLFRIPKTIVDEEDKFHNFEIAECDSFFINEEPHLKELDPFYYGAIIPKSDFSKALTSKKLEDKVMKIYKLHGLDSSK